MSLRTLEEKLAEEGFLRIHNSFLVNMSYIAALQTSGVTLTTDQTLPVSLHGIRRSKQNTWHGEGALMGYALSILMCALQTWLYTKLWDSFFTRRFSGKAFWAYLVIWTAAITVSVNILPNDFRYSYAVDFVMELALFYGMCLTLYCGRWDRRLFVVITGYACFFPLQHYPKRHGCFIWV